MYNKITQEHVFVGAVAFSLFGLVALWGAFIIHRGATWGSSPPEDHPPTHQNEPALMLCIEGKDQNYCLPIKAYWRGRSHHEADPDKKETDAR